MCLVQHSDLWSLALYHVINCLIAVCISQLEGTCKPAITVLGPGGCVLISHGSTSQDGVTLSHKVW